MDSGGAAEGGQLTDIHSYLATFNKEISSGTSVPQTQSQTIFQNSGQELTFFQAQTVTDAGQANGEVATTVQNYSSTDHEQPNATIVQYAGGDSSAQAVKVLASMADSELHQSRADNVTQQIDNHLIEQSSKQLEIADAVPSTITVKKEKVDLEEGEHMVATAASDGSQFQTVTIMPSEVNQGGEVSYVLIVSQPDGEEKKSDDPDLNSLDMSVYDFKEEQKQAVLQAQQAQQMAMEPGQRRIIKVTTRKQSTTMQSQLMCNYCNYTSPKRYLLTRHMKTHSEERPHKCNICDRGFKTVASLQNHINTHTGVRPHKCKECESAFTTSGELVRHVRYRHTFEKPHHCSECDYTSVELSKLKRHMRSHTGERPYQCPHCSYASPDTYKLKRHLRIHTGEKPYECDICHSRFTQSNSLKAHRLIHTGNKPVFQCELCPTTCGRKTDLKIHVQKLHTSDTPLQCRKCGKAFPDRYTYKIHLKTHDGEKCFRCELCSYAALSQRHLENHMLTHTGEKPYSCEDCGQTFRQRQLMKRHQNIYHNNEYIAPPPKEKMYECGECHKLFAHRGNLLRHMALHDPDLIGAEESQLIFQEEEEGEVTQEQLQQQLAEGEQVAVQLVTVGDGSQTQIYLQVDDGEDGVPKEEEMEVGEMVEHQVLSDQVQEIPMEEKAPEEEEEQVVIQEKSIHTQVESLTISPLQHLGPLVIASPLLQVRWPQQQIAVQPRRRGRPPKNAHLANVVTPLAAQNANVQKVSRRLNEEVEAEEEGEVEEGQVDDSLKQNARHRLEEPIDQNQSFTPRRRGRPRLNASPKTPMTPKPEEVMKIKEEQKQKDIEECFGFE